MSILNKGNNSTVDLIITTEPINEIEMSKIKEFLENGSSDCPPGEALNALDVVLQNRPLALRLVYVMYMHTLTHDTYIEQFGTHNTHYLEKYYFFWNFLVY